MHAFMTSDETVIEIRDVAKNFGDSAASRVQALDLYHTELEIEVIRQLGASACPTFASTYRELWDARLDRLDAHLQRMKKEQNQGG